MSDNMDNPCRYGCLTMEEHLAHGDDVDDSEQAVTGAGKVVRYPKHILIKMTQRDFDALCAMAKKRGQHRAEVVRAAFLAYLHEEEKKEDINHRVDKMDMLLRVFDARMKSFEDKLNTVLNRVQTPRLMD